MRVWFADLPERGVPSEAHNALMNIALRAGHKGFSRIVLDYYRTDVNRMRAATSFMQLSNSGDDVLVMLDDDHDHPVDIIDRLIENTDCEVVGALAFMRGAPFHACAFVMGSDGLYHAMVDYQRGLYKVAAIGHAAIAIRRSALEKLMTLGVGSLWKYEYPSNGKPQSEDIYFSKLCALAGVDIWCDTTIVTPHLMTSAIAEGAYLLYRGQHPEQTAQMKVNARAAVVDNLRISVLLPTRKRADGLLRTIQSLIDTSPVRLEIVVVTEKCDEAARDIAQSFGSERADIKIVTSPNGYGACAAFQLAYRSCSGEWAVLASDDAVFMPGWLTAAYPYLENGFVGFWDGHTSPNLYATFYMIRRDLIEKHLGGYFAMPWYHSWYIDVETWDRLQLAGVPCVVCTGSRVEHNHFVFGAADDETYQVMREWHEVDRLEYEKRKSLGFPQDLVIA